MKVAVLLISSLDYLSNCRVQNISLLLLSYFNFFIPSLFLVGNAIVRNNSDSFRTIHTGNRLAVEVTAARANSDINNGSEIYESGSGDISVDRRSHFNAGTSGSNRHRSDSSSSSHPRNAEPSPSPIPRGRSQDVASTRSSELKEITTSSRVKMEKTDKDMIDYSDRSRGEEKERSQSRGVNDGKSREEDTDLPFPKTAKKLGEARCEKVSDFTNTKSDLIAIPPQANTVFSEAKSQSKSKSIDKINSSAGCSDSKQKLKGRVSDENIETKTKIKTKSETGSDAETEMEEDKKDKEKKIGNIKRGEKQKRMKDKDKAVQAESEVRISQQSENGSNSNADKKSVVNFDKIPSQMDSQRLESPVISPTVVTVSASTNANANANTNANTNVNTNASSAVSGENALVSMNDASSSSSARTPTKLLASSFKAVRNLLGFSSGSRK